MTSIGTPQESKGIETQEEVRNLDLEITEAVEEDFPSKHLLFLPFEMAQIIAKIEAHHRQLPILEKAMNRQRKNPSIIKTTKK